MDVLSLLHILPQPLLVGVQAGRSALTLLIKAASRRPLAQLVALDFQGIELATASGLRQLLVPFWSWLLERGAVGVVANANADTLDDVRLVAEACERQFICAQLADGRLRRPVLYGPLDAKLALALELVLEAGEADAKTVHERSQEKTLVTVWNNRLAALEALGLLSQRKVGKTKLYSPVLKGMTYGV